MCQVLQQVNYIVTPLMLKNNLQDQFSHSVMSDSELNWVELFYHK